MFDCLQLAIIILKKKECLIKTEKIDIKKLAWAIPHCIELTALSPGWALRSLTVHCIITRLGVEVAFVQLVHNTKTIFD